MTPAGNRKCFMMSKTPHGPSLNCTMAEFTTHSRRSLSTKSPLGHFLQIILFKASLPFCVLPCRHRDNNSSQLRSLKIGLTSSWIHIGKFIDSLCLSLLLCPFGIYTMTLYLLGKTDAFFHCPQSLCNGTI